MCGTKNFASVRLYSAPQLHRTIVAILGICAYGTPNKWKPASTIKLIHYQRLGAKLDHPPVADISAYNAFKGSKASMLRTIWTTVPGAASCAPRREPVGFAMPFRSHPTLKFSAEVFPLLGTSS